MANKQLEVRDPDTKELISYMTYTAKMVVMDYARCDSLVTIKETPIDFHYKVNLLH